MNARMLVWLCACALSAVALAQVTAPAPAPLTLTLKDALERAQVNAPQFLSAVSDLNAASEDVLQAR